MFPKICGRVGKIVEVVAEKSISEPNNCCYSQRRRRLGVKGRKELEDCSMFERSRGLRDTEVDAQNDNVKK
ncbi:hypothetical protein BDZ97DRAFT_1837053, partial [Flammula alnicola]